MNVIETCRTEVLRFRSQGASQGADGGSDDIRGPWTLCDLSGVAVLEGKVLDCRMAGIDGGGTGLDEMLGCYGEWRGVFSRTDRNGNQEYLIVCDENGFMPVFWNRFQLGSVDGLYVGESLPALLQVLRDEGRATQVDWDLAFTHILSTSPTLNTVGTDSTFAESVNLLHVGEALYYSNGVARVVPRPRTSTRGDLSYGELVERGIERATSLVSQVQAGGFGSLQVNLSGGVDSRVVLALAMAAGDPRAFGIVTHPPASWRPDWLRSTLSEDLRIATMIVEEFGLSWQDAVPRHYGQISFQDRLLLHRCYRDGWDFGISMGPMVVADDTTSVSFRGGGGEGLRSSKFALVVAEDMAQRAEEDVLTYKSAKRMAARIARCGSSLAAYGLRVPEALTEALLRGRGESLNGAANKWYMDFRSRSHFGHHRWSLRPGNNLTIHPLAISEFREAASLLPEDERIAGGLPFDIIEMLAPRLNRIPFAGGGWDKLLEARALGPLDGGSGASDGRGGSALSSWKMAQASIEDAQDVGRASSLWWGSGSSGRGLAPESWTAAGREGLSWLLELVLESKRSFPGSLPEDVRGMVDSGRIAFGATFGKLLTMADVLGALPRVPVTLVDYRSGRMAPGELPRSHDWDDLHAIRQAMWRPTG